ncbi:MULTISPECIES: arsenite methyltransferase [Clostridium]|uniref:Arsenite methyltransferase n=1 Tax=Clostridium frigoriphilum TaxID=443253 RepID=A0ABU7UL51_9CLOT|nr:arsenite methyltransferase [Clostridium sp. DSM 17811]MBU3097810.1 arsenite methyltransferase [Clostridium sp. DSM 17811]
MSDIKGEVKKYYGGIASRVNQEAKGNCKCSSSCCSNNNSDIYDLDYLDNLPQEAINASLGCANPLVFGELKNGETVLDLGSGGGIDVLIASKYVGSTGKVYGLDMTDEMLRLANTNKQKMGVENVEFLKGYIEDIPIDNNKIDVILSNCVINLCEDKEKALSEAYRVLKPGGRLAIADIVILKDISEKIKNDAQMWVGCIAGALPIEEYRNVLLKVGFKNVEINPINIYTKDTIESIIKSKNLQDKYNSSDIEMADSAFAGALVKGIK